MDIYISMNSKEPNEIHNDKIFKNVVSRPGKALRISFGENNPEFLNDNKFKNSVFVQLKIITGQSVKLRLFSQFTQLVTKLIDPENLGVIDDRLSRKAERQFDIISKKCGSKNLREKSPDDVIKELDTFVS